MEIRALRGEARGNRIYGRGACDTKGNLAAAVKAIQAISQSRIPFRGKILLGILVDEEGMMSGVKHFIRQGWTNGVDAALICEPVDNHLCITQKGALRAELITSGKMSHGAMPLAGLNPIPPMVSILEKIRQLEEEEIERLGKDPYFRISEHLAHCAPGSCQRGTSTQRDAFPMQGIAGHPNDSRAVHEALKKQLVEVVEEEERSIRQSLLSGPLKEIREGLEKGLSKGISFEAKLQFFEDRPWTKTSGMKALSRQLQRRIGPLQGKNRFTMASPGATDGTFLSAWRESPSSPWGQVKG